MSSTLTIGWKDGKRLKNIEINARLSLFFGFKSRFSVFFGCLVATVLRWTGSGCSSSAAVAKRLLGVG